MTLEQMQREGRELIGHLEVDDIHADLDDGKGTQVWDGKDYLILALDRHTANTWKACKDAILESGLLEEKDDLDVIVQEKLKEDRERIFKEIDWYFKTTDYKEVLVSDLQNIINSDTDVTN